MSKILIEQFGACHKFVNEINYFLPVDKENALILPIS